MQLQEQERIMALDVGDRRIGVAVTDPFGWTVQPVETIERRDHAQTFQCLKDLFKIYNVQKIVLGLPLLAGAEGPQAKKIRHFERELVNFLKKEELLIAIETWDETLTTAEVEEVLIAHDVTRAKRKKIVDKLAAVRILESYLEGMAEEE